MRQRFRALEGRLAHIESVVASDEYELNRKFRDRWAITIIGIPFAWAHLKLAGISLWPIGMMMIVPGNAATAAID